MFTILGIYWIYSGNKQRQFNNCRWLFEQKAFTEESRQKSGVDEAYQECRTTILNP